MILFLFLVALGEFGLILFLSWNCREQGREIVEMIRIINRLAERGKGETV